MSNLHVCVSFVPYLAVLTTQSLLSDLAMGALQVIFLTPAHLHGRLVSYDYGAYLRMTTTQFVQDSITLPFGQKPRVSFSEQDPDSLSHFLDQPLKTWQSTLLFTILLGLLLSVSVFIGKKYVEIIQVNRCCYCEDPPTLEDLQQLGSDSETCEEGTSVSIVSGSRGDSDSDIRSRSPSRFTPPASVAIGEVYEGRIAQRRRASSARSVRNVPAMSTAMDRPEHDVSHETKLTADAA